MSYVVAVEGLENLHAFDDAKGKITQAAQRAINRTAESARADSSRRIRQQVNFPAQYLSPSAGRLAVSKRASNTDLEAVIRARHRATSLARFSSGGGRRGSGVSLQVKPGVSKRIKRAFLIKLRQGKGSVDTKFNLGLAIRLKPGETIQNKRQMVRMGKGLYLLYGPSVDQVFQTVAEDVAPDAADKLEAEFLRLLEL